MDAREAKIRDDAPLWELVGETMAAPLIGKLD